MSKLAFKQSVIVDFRIHIKSKLLDHVHCLPASLNTAAKILNTHKIVSCHKIILIHWCSWMELYCFQIDRARNPC